MAHLVGARGRPCQVWNAGVAVGEDGVVGFVAVAAVGLAGATPLQHSAL